MRKIFFLATTAFLAMMTSAADMYAQCAMCRASVENSISQGENTIGAGLNAGILYLGAMPYLIFVVIVWAWYRHSKKETSKKLKVANILNSKLK